jgi:hypothetical protein
MAVQWDIFVPAVVFAHLLGAVLLLYSLEKVSGVVSKTWNRVTRRIRNGAKTDDADQLRQKSESALKGGPTAELEAAAHKARVVTSWRRGCSCEVIQLHMFPEFRPRAVVPPSTGYASTDVVVRG